MSKVVIFKPNKKPQLLRSVNTPDYEDDVDVLVNPDVSKVKNVPMKYWKRSGNKVVEMTTVEKKAVDDRETEEENIRINNLDTLSVKTLARVLIKKGVISKTDLITTLKGVKRG